jgi:sterol desaturase/sphingolipid hydroxylase (fatty acid hydroxylase superfamily)
MKFFKNSNRKKTATGKAVFLIGLMLIISPFLFLAETIRQYNFLFHGLLMATGWLSWTYIEYFMHRFIMHGSDNSKGIARLLNHMHHHTAPSDIRITTPHRIMMVSGSIILITVSILLDNYFTLFCGYFTGFSFFCLIHVVLHREWSKKIFPHLHQYHIYHHCKFPDKCFGVTVIWWDRLLGTAPVKKRETTQRILSFYYKQWEKRKRQNFPDDTFLAQETD